MGAPTLAQAQTDVSLRLGDPTFVHWTAAEVTRYLVEALRTWNALTQTQRSRGTFVPTLGAPFYDLPTVLPTLRSYTVTDRQVITDLEYALMEPPTPTAWTGTEQFTLAELTAALQRRRDQFLKETGAVVTRETSVVTPDVNGRVPLPADVITIRRAAWMNAAGTVVPLHREDEWAMTTFARATRQTPTDPTKVWPVGYSVGVTPPLTVQLGPPPLVQGTLDLLSVVNGAVLNPVTPVLLGIPDDWSWVVKWGALADLLGKDGLAFDPNRAAYCQARWQQGVQLATAASVVLDAELAGASTRLVSVHETDTYRRSWQTTPDVPVNVITVGQNLVGLVPPPSAGGLGAVTLDLVVNMPVPVVGTDVLAIDVQNYDVLLDYVEHLAQFKEGPGQVDAAMALYDRFAKAAGVTVSLNTASVPNRPALFQQSVQDVRVKPRVEEPEPSLP